jgi:hypothetical protein
MRRLLAAAVALPMLAGCAGDRDARPIAYTEREFVVREALPSVYSRMVSRIESCVSFNSLFTPRKLVSALHPGGGRAEIAVLRRAGEKPLWGADLQAVAGGTRVATYAARNLSVGQVSAMMRAWAENRQPKQATAGVEFADC